MTSSNEWWRHNSPLCFYFLLLWLFFYHLSLSVWIIRGFAFQKENILLLIELKYKLLNYNKVTNLCHWIALLYNNNIFHKNAFLNLEILLKDLFEKCWNQNSCVVKMNSLFYLSIVQSDYFPKLISHAFWTILRLKMQIENALKNHYFLVPYQKNADVIKFLLGCSLQKVCELIYNRLSYTHTMFHNPSSSGTNFR